ncbi:glycosyltransferase family 32 protein [Tepidamorphus sp. 3E244]|uniref:glycosyltransferase family 32 protein n=1 Tax=Tepidamorphus sp. 3E244 TaxID=3385498 RepID=UPI0038FC6FB8
MSALRFLTSRVIKFSGNIFKTLYYVIHPLCPNKRYTIPARNAPRRAAPDDGIVRIIWQTNFTNRVTLPVYANYLCNRLMAPTYEFRFLITDDRTEMMRTEYPPEYLEAYSRLTIGAAQADIWRVLTVHKFGGVYIDIDGNLMWPLDRIRRPGHEELYVEDRDQMVSNFFFAAQPGSAVLKEIAERILANIRSPKRNKVFSITGPNNFREVLKNRPHERVLGRITCDQGNFSNRYYQYIDKNEGKWHELEKEQKVVRD